MKGIASMQFTRTEKIGSVIMGVLLVALVLTEGPAGLGALAFAVAFVAVARVTRDLGSR
jgi:hypothetical protein